jgi:cell division transport system permease protein
MSSILKKSASNIARNWITTIPTILVIAIVLLLFHRLLLAHLQANEALKGIQQKFSITVYLKDDADPFAVGNVIAALEERSDVVAPVIYTSKEEAWKTMSKAFSLDNDLLQKYKFSLPASITITPTDPQNTASIEAYLDTNAGQLLRDPLTTGAKQKNITNQMIEFINNVKESTLKTIVLFIILFLFGGALLISSTIHLAISSRHKEIAIMKLVGASYSKIILPFVIEGILLGILAFLLYAGLVLLMPSQFSALITKPSLNAFLFECVAVIVLSGLSSYLTTVFHIRKKTFI